VTATAPPAPATPPAAAAAAAAPSPFDELRARAAAWTAPISEAAPAGVSAKFDPLYESLAREAAKLDSPMAVPVDWPLVVQQGGELLTRLSKDLLIAAYFAQGLSVTRGFSGLTTGLVLVTDLIERYWPTMFPEVARMKGRVNALTWLLDRIAPPLTEAKAGPGDRAEIEALLVVSKRLAEVTRQNMGSATPAFGPLLQALERLRASIPAEAPPPSASAATSAPPSQSTESSGASAPSAGAAPTFTAPSPPPASGGDATEYLRSVGNALVEASGPLRQASAADPTPYRMLRVGLYLPFTGAPPATGGKTRVPPLQPAVRARLDRMAENAKWPEVIDEAESALPSGRFCLDLHRYTALALGSLGDSHKSARQVVLAEMAGLLRRMPEWPALTASDGTPLASPETRAWIDAEIAGGDGASGGGGAQAGRGGGNGPADGARLAEARKLAFGGKLAEALALTQVAIIAAPTGEAKFLARMEMAELASGAGQPGLARAIFEDLDREIRERGLESWDPKLAARCLEGLWTALRAGTKSAAGVKGSVEPATLTVIYDRLCRLDPAAALRLGAG
jgi:type VI secretion system protein VasJ